jgi:hypothetical protein
MKLIQYFTTPKSGYAKRAASALFFLCIFGTADVRSEDISPILKSKISDQADQAIKGSAVSPVRLDTESEPGYIRSATGPQSQAFYSYSTFQLEESRARLAFGPAFLFSDDGIRTEVAPSLRYRISPHPWSVSEERPWHLGSFPLSLSIELGGLFPSSNLETEIRPISDSAGDLAIRQLQYQIYLALIDELPHGKQQWVIPEIGGGISFISVKTLITNFDHIGNYDGEDSENSAVKPYFQAGLHFFPDHFFSLLLQGSYIALPKQNTFSMPADHLQIPNMPVHENTFGFPSAIWSVSAKIQMKLVWPTPVHAPMLPQLMPPWLLNSYSTEPISPWIASIRVQQKFNEPGQPAVGNVFFQYKNRWAERVEIIADFTDWIPQRMIRDRTGMWVAVKDLPAGKFRYNYVVDGHREILDPWNKNVDPGSRDRGSSLVVIK